MNYNAQFVKRKMDKWSNYITEFELPDYKDLPSIGLYMDQIITLLSQYLGYLPNSYELNAETFITANAINNYVRLGAIPAPIKKKYYANHIAYLIMICVLMPSFSISSLLSLIPAVSQRLIFFPLNSKLSEIKSLVVPFIDETIARSYPKIAFIRLDLPTFVSPTRATSMPSFIILP